MEETVTRQINFREQVDPLTGLEVDKGRETTTKTIKVEQKPIPEEKKGK